MCILCPNLSEDFFHYGSWFPWMEKNKQTRSEELRELLQYASQALMYRVGQDRARHVHIPQRQGRWPEGVLASLS